MTDFQQIYELYFRDVYRYALSLCRNEALAEEITQETFFKALQKIDSFDGRCKLSVWLCQIAKNTFFSMRRREKGLEKYNDAPLFLPDESLEEGLSQQETALRIHKILHSLKEPYKEVFSLRAFGELSFQQIGMLFDKTESWARVTYHRAKLKIKEELK